ncbi:TPA: hypothetical protein ACHOUB_004763, partial [Escherichia coli]
MRLESVAKFHSPKSPMMSDSLLAIVYWFS